MNIGVPKEIKNNENRVAITPGGVLELTKRGHAVRVQTQAGMGMVLLSVRLKGSPLVVINCIRYRRQW